MRASALLGWGILLAFAFDRVGAQPPTKPSQTEASSTEASDLAAIRQTSLDFEAAFLKGDAAEIAAHWTENGEYVADQGQVFTGRAAIEHEYEQLLSANKGLRLRIVIDSLRLLSDSAAIEDGRAFLDPSPVGAPAFSSYTAVHVKVDGKWLMFTVRDTRVETQTSYHNLADLEWLIGTWVSEEHGSRTESVCSWIANKSFVQRKYTVTHPDHTTSSGLQLIGFNPQGGHLQSWNFSSDGGYAEGIWSPRENGWSAEIRSTLSDGRTSTAINLLTRLDDNAYAWQSVQRKLGDESLPDSDEVVLKRQSN